MSHGHLYDQILYFVRSGFFSKKQVFDRVADMCLDPSEDLSAIAPKLRGYAAKQLALYEAEERTWNERSVNDELDAAFVAMNEAGLVALQNAGWTMSTGWEDCWYEHRQRKAHGKASRGAVFYHEQDTERGVAGEGLFLAFGVFAEEDDQFPERNAEIGREVCAFLSEHGIDHEWNGDPRSRIRVSPFTWRRRRNTQAPPMPAKPTPWRRFQHGDGRRWEIRATGATVELRIGSADDEVTERKRPARDETDARKVVETLIQEQIADGFSEIA